MPLAEHDMAVGPLAIMRPVSIHVPLAEHDTSFRSSCSSPNEFQFTCPSRSTTRQVKSAFSSAEVSIHVPLAEHDSRARYQTPVTALFNSRAPRGARRIFMVGSDTSSVFQFTCPSRSTTALLRHTASLNLFQFTCPSRSTTAH